MKVGLSYSLDLCLLPFVAFLSFAYFNPFSRPAIFESFCIKFSVDIASLESWESCSLLKVLKSMEGNLSMEDRQSSFSRHGNGVWRSLRDGDFEEEDVWEVLKERKDSTFKVCQSIESSIPVRRHLPSAARMIPRTLSAVSNNSSSNNGSSSSSSSSSCEANGVKQQSAPVNIPDWSKISGKMLRKTSSSRNGSWHHDDDDDGNHSYNDESYEAVNGFDDADDEYNSMVPPHEILARRLARSQITSSSVFEGVGRKLKGRDLRKVRNAVLTKTGFLE